MNFGMNEMMRTAVRAVSRRVEVLFTTTPLCNLLSAALRVWLLHFLWVFSAVFGGELREEMSLHPVFQFQPLDHIEMLVRGDEYEVVCAGDGGNHHVHRRNWPPCFAQLNPKQTKFNGLLILKPPYGKLRQK